MGNIALPVTGLTPPLLSPLKLFPGLPLSLAPASSQLQSPLQSPKAQDQLQLLPLGLPTQAVPFVEAAQQPDLKTSLAEIAAITDPAVRAEHYQDLLADLIDDKNYQGLLEAFRAVQADKQLPLSQRDASYRIVNQSLLEADLHDKAIELNAAYPVGLAKDRVRQEIVKYLISEGQTIKAAQLRGQGNLGGVALAELERLKNSAKSLGQDIYETWRRTVMGLSLGEQIADQAREDAQAGKKYRQAFLDYGNLACAYTVSRILDHTRLDDSADSAECNTLAAQLKKSGFTQVAGDKKLKPVAKNFEYREGDIIFFTRKNKAGFGHVGVIAKIEGDTVWMVHNSSAKRQVVQVPLNTYSRQPVAVLRPPEK